MYSFAASKLEDVAALEHLLAQAEWTADKEGRQGLIRFAELVSQWGARTDLVKATSAQELVEVLFLDALQMVPFLTEAKTLVDVGAGAGAPALPLLLLQPGLSAVMVEPRRRRVAFIRTAIGQLSLGTRAQVKEEHWNDAPPSTLFDAAMSRATFEPARWLQLGAQLAPRVFLLLGRLDAPSLSPGMVVHAERRYTVPSSGAERRLIVVDVSSHGPE